MIIKNKNAVMNKYEKLKARLSSLQEKKEEIIQQEKQILEELSLIEKDVHIIELEARIAELEQSAGIYQEPNQETDEQEPYPVDEGIDGE